MCVCERESEGERESEKKGKRERERASPKSFPIITLSCVLHGSLIQLILYTDIPVQCCYRVRVCSLPHAPCGSLSLSTHAPNQIKYSCHVLVQHTFHVPRSTNKNILLELILRRLLCVCTTISCIITCMRKDMATPDQTNMSQPTK